ncbi:MULTISPECIES: hybrid sensor histidine kinase/response regulator [unclassified Roseateles]|uniref:ATP-binding response regulator n=1 Tax=unclassified Roseateles TaxID=2626991 RepID=UPI0006F42FB4|nr:MULTISPECIES: hybrid sensor histidine kinase/response regulator [unclassified Roseateles]KQW48233.1 hypothetical protein ASC81_25975 [Pelomonas sp. Root405]KRA75384.1 hypothetical protein ASD88_25955 [Pelomonas sp. Root662]
MLRHPTDERTRRAMLLLFYAQSGVSLVAAALLVLLHVGAQIDRVALPGLLAWAVAFTVLIGLRARWKRQAAQLPETINPTAWERRAELGALLTGVLWAAALVMAFDAQQRATQMYAAMLACVTCVASINVMAPQPRAFVMLIAPVSATLITLFLSLGGWGGAYSALLVLAAIGLAMSLTLRHARLLRESHAMRFEREALLAQAQAAREAQTRFLAAASHDLRQPVHALGLLAAQAAHELQGRRAAQTAEQLQAMAQALDGLVEGLLDVSRLDSGALQPQCRSVPLQPLFERLSTEYAVLAEAKGLQWRLRPTALWVRSDAQQLERLLRNLLSNALTHTERGGVLLAARRRAGRVQVAVWDTGPGIAPEHHERIFQEFVQLTNPGRDRKRGHGLGLAIVARLARLMEHPVALRSRLGRGSCFAVSLPEDAPRLLTEPRTVPQGQPLQGRCVALVEDDEAVREATANLLRTWGCEVWADAAVTPLLARLRTAGARPQRLISDWRLGEGDGLSAITVLREAFGDGLPALLISGETLPMSAKALRALRVQPARKPLPPAALRAWLSAPSEAPGKPPSGQHAEPHSEPH